MSLSFKIKKAEKEFAPGFNLSQMGQHTFLIKRVAGHDYDQFLHLNNLSKATGEDEIIEAELDENGVEITPETIIPFTPEQAVEVVSGFIRDANFIVERKAKLSKGVPDLCLRNTILANLEDGYVKDEDLTDKPVYHIHEKDSSLTTSNFKINNMFRNVTTVPLQNP